MIPSYLIVAQIVGPIEDKNNKTYKTLLLETPGESLHKDIITKESFVLKSPNRRAKLLAWEKSYLDGHPDFGYFLEKGDKVMGEIIDMPVEAYEIIDRETGEIKKVGSYTTVVLGDSSKSDWNYRVHETFRKKGKTIRALPQI